MAGWFVPRRVHARSLWHAAHMVAAQDITQVERQARSVEPRGAGRVMVRVAAKLRLEHPEVFQRLVERSR